MFNKKATATPAIDEAVAFIHQISRNIKPSNC